VTGERTEIVRVRPGSAPRYTRLRIVPANWQDVRLDARRGGSPGPQACAPALAGAAATAMAARVKAGMDRAML
jgi:hypothetical protein